MSLLSLILLFVVIVAAILAALSLWHYPKQIFLSLVVGGGLFYAMVQSNAHGHEGFGLVTLAGLVIAGLLFRKLLQYINRPRYESWR
jgi:hypothetical protein